MIAEILDFLRTPQKPRAMKVPFVLVVCCVAFAFAIGMNYNHMSNLEDCNQRVASAKKEVTNAIADLDNANEALKKATSQFDSDRVTAQRQVDSANATYIVSVKQLNSSIEAVEEDSGVSAEAAKELESIELACLEHHDSSASNYFDLIAQIAPRNSKQQKLQLHKLTPSWKLQWSSPDLLSKSEIPIWPSFVLRKPTICK